MATTEINRSNKYTTKPSSAGFSMVELMIVMIIIAVLAVILYPNYTDSTRKARRSDAIKSIQLFSNRLEKFMTYCNSYTEQLGGAISENGSNARCSGLGVHTIEDTNINSERGYYSLSITCSDECLSYSVQAVARTSQLEDNDCQIFTYNSKGVKSSKDSSGQFSTEKCWK